MVRIFHTSDTHLGHAQYPRLAPSGLNQREEDIYAAWHHIIDLAVAEKPDLFIHAGDLFDGVRPGNRALGHAMEGFLKLSRAGIPTVAIAGNHEHPKMRETGSPFRLFEHLPGIHVVYQGARQTIPLQVGTPSPGNGGNGIHAAVRVHAVPQCSDNDVLASEVASAQTRKSALTQASASAAGIDILVVHGSVPSIAAFGHGEFNELTLDSSWFPPFDYVALGHFHGTQQVAPNAWYCGAPERVSIAESGQEKGFLDVRIDAHGAHPKFRPIPTRPYLDLPVLDGDGLDAAALRLAAETNIARVPAGAVARLRMRKLEPSLRGVLDVRALQRAGAHALYLDLRTEWKEAGLGIRGLGELGHLATELDAFAATQPMEGLDRQRILEKARGLLVDGVTVDGPPNGHGSQP